MKRIWHPWHKWECYRDGFYSSSPPDGMDEESCRIAYAEFLSDIDLFASYMNVISECWIYSCEQFLSNESMNRIAWLGQSAMFAASGVPSIFRGGFKLLSDKQQYEANNAAKNHLGKWVYEYQSKGSKAHKNMEPPRLPKRHTRRSATGAYEVRIGPVIQGDMFGFA